jgi:YD repeat-containing protein
VQGNEINTLNSRASHDLTTGRQRPMDCAPVRQRWRWIAALGLMALALVSASLCRANSGPVTYAYDALGRLVAVVDGSGNAGVYKYDAAGNLLAITPTTSGTVSIFSFMPNNGSVGQSVTIYGDGFSTTPSQNTVTFYNGKTATVTGSTLTTITTTVPTGATTGPIKVTVGVNSATSTGNFTVN